MTKCDSVETSCHCVQDHLLAIVRCVRAAGQVGLHKNCFLCCLPAEVVVAFGAVAPPGLQFLSAAAAAEGVHGKQLAAGCPVSESTTARKLSA